MSTEDVDSRLGALADALGPDGPPSPESPGVLEGGEDVARAAALLRDVFDRSDDGIAELLDELPDSGAPEPELPLPQDYEVVEELGRGGMGIVFRARQRSLDREVAVKVLRPGELLFGQSLRRFQQEAKTLAKLRHRHIVTIHEVGGRAGQIYYTMDLVRGPSLAELLKRGALTTARCLRLLRQVASAVAYVHSHGIIHRDLKPANILIDENGDAVVTDFGLALEIGAASDLTLTGQVLGTPAYMSPEQARGDTSQIGEATDVYAMGAVLYECLTGKRPWAGLSAAEQVYAVIHQEPTHPRKIDARIPVDLALICQKAMRKRPGGRYATAQALLEDLERFDGGRQVRAEAPSRMYQLGRFVRRHAAHLFILIAALTALGILSSTLIPRAEHYRSELIRVTWQHVVAGRPEAAVATYDRLLDEAGDDAEWDLRISAARARLALLGERVLRGERSRAAALVARLRHMVTSDEPRAHEWNKGDRVWTKPLPGEGSSQPVRASPEWRRCSEVEGELNWWIAAERFMHTPAVSPKDLNDAFRGWNSAWADLRNGRHRVPPYSWLYQHESRPIERLLSGARAAVDEGHQQPWRLVGALDTGMYRAHLGPPFEDRLLRKMGSSHVEGVIRNVLNARPRFHVSSVRYEFGPYLAELPLVSIGDRLAALASNNAETTRVRLAAAYVLCDVAGLPRLFPLKPRPGDTESVIAWALRAWKRTRELQGVDALQERLRLAVEVCRQGSGDGRLNNADFRSWVSHHVPGEAPYDLAELAELAEWIEVRVADIEQRLVGALNLPPAPSAAIVASKLPELRGRAQVWAHHLLTCLRPSAEPVPRPMPRRRGWVTSGLVQWWYEHLQLPPPQGALQLLELRMVRGGRFDVALGDAGLRIVSEDGPPERTLFFYELGYRFPGSLRPQLHPTFPGFARLPRDRTANAHSNAFSLEVATLHGARGIDLQVWRSIPEPRGLDELVLVAVPSAGSIADLGAFSGNQGGLYYVPFGRLPTTSVVVHVAADARSASWDEHRFRQVLKRDLDKLCQVFDETANDWNDRAGVLDEMSVLLELARHLPFPRGDGTLLEVQRRAEELGQGTHAQLLAILCRAVAVEGGYASRAELDADWSAVTDLHGVTRSYGERCDFWLPVAALTHDEGIRAYAWDIIDRAFDRDLDSHAVRRIHELGVPVPERILARLKPVDRRTSFDRLVDQHTDLWIVILAGVLLPLLFVLFTYLPIVPTWLRVRAVGWGVVIGVMALAFRVDVEAVVFPFGLAALLALARCADLLEAQLPGPERAGAAAWFKIALLPMLIGSHVEWVSVVAGLPIAFGLLHMCRTARRLREQPIDPIDYLFYGGGAILAALLCSLQLLGWLPRPFSDGILAIIVGGLVALVLLDMVVSIRAAARAQASLLRLQSRQATAQRSG